MSTYEKIDGNCEYREYIDEKHICRLYAGDKADRNICNSTDDNGTLNKYECKNYCISRNKFHI